MHYYIPRSSLAMGGTTTCWGGVGRLGLKPLMYNTKELMHCHCGTNNRAPRWTFTDPCRGETRCPGGVSVFCLASPAAIYASDTTKVYIWRLDNGCEPTLYRKCHSHNRPGKSQNNTWVELLAWNCTTSSTRQREQVWQKCKISLMWLVSWLISHH